MNSIAVLTAQPKKFKVGDKEYQLHPLTIEDLGKLQAWIDSQFPDPFDVVKNAFAKHEYNVAQQQFMMRVALEQASRPKHLIGSPEADELLMSMEGIRQFILISIQKGDPDFTIDDLNELVAKMTSTDIAQAMNSTGLDMVVTDPKSEPLNIVPPKKPNGSAMSRRQRRAAKQSTGGASSTKHSLKHK